MTSTDPDRTAPDQSVLIAAVAAAIETVLAEPSAGVVRVQVGEEILLERAWGLADRRHGIAMTPTTRSAWPAARRFSPPLR